MTIAFHTTRSPKWQSRFAAYTAQRESTSFAWGSNDKLLYAAGCVEAILGTNPLLGFTPMASVTGPYSTEAQANSILAAHGGFSGLISECYNEGTFVLAGQAPSAAWAANGDLVLINHPSSGQALGICNGDKALMAGPDGQIIVPMTMAIAAWWVGQRYALEESPFCNVRSV